MADQEKNLSDESSAEVETTGPTKSAENWSRILTGLGILGALALLIIVVNGIANLRTVFLWGIFAAAMLFIILGAGLGAQGKLLGFLIDPASKRMSLPRLRLEGERVVSAGQ